MLEEAKWQSVARTLACGIDDLNFHILVLCYSVQYVPVIVSKILELVNWRPFLLCVGLKRRNKDKQNINKIWMDRLL